MSNMRNYLGEGARAEQKLKLWMTAGIPVGEGEFTVISHDQVAAKSDEINVGIFKGPVRVDLKVTGPGRCKVELWAGKTYHVDEKATYKDVNNSREVYCKLLPNIYSEVSIVLWRDGKYSNFKIWGKLGVWTPILHLWAHPLKAAGLAEVPELPLNADLEPALPSVQA